MIKRAALFAASLLVVSSLASAAFTAGMTPIQMEAEVKAQVAAGRTPADIAKAAAFVGLSASSVTTAMILAGVNPAAAVSAVIAAGGDVSQVVSAAIAAGVPADIVRSAALSAGANGRVVAFAIDAAVERRSVWANARTPGPNAGASSSGGGTSSAR